MSNAVRSTSTLGQPAFLNFVLNRMEARRERRERGIPVPEIELAPTYKKDITAFGHIATVVGVDGNHRPNVYVLSKMTETSYDVTWSGWKPHRSPRKESWYEVLHVERSEYQSFLLPADTSDRENQHYLYDVVERERRTALRNYRNGQRDKAIVSGVQFGLDVAGMVPLMGLVD